MSNPLSPIDISNMPELRDLVEEVEAAKKPRALKRNEKVVAIISPVVEEKTETPQQTAAYQSSLAAIGSWSDLNAEEIIANIYRWRNEGSRPPTRP
jgi:hypothetical protein